jgi:AcrR family transcriptional regulator
MSSQPTRASDEALWRARRHGGRPREGRHVVEMQRRRLLTGAVAVAHEQGMAAVTVANVCQGAGISRATFYELFADREGCLLAAFEDGLAEAQAAIVGGALGKDWCEQLAGGVRALLAFLQERPDVAELLFLHAPAAGPAVMARRSAAIDQAIAVLDQQGATAAGRRPPPLAGEGAVGAVFSVLHARLLDQRLNGRVLELLDLAGPLTALLVQPYMGRAAALRALDASSPAERNEARARRDPAACLQELPIRLTYRTARVLGAIAASPGASSKQVAIASDVGDEGQMSRLLARLERFDLVCNAGGDPAKGEARAWRLTASGEDVVEALVKA